MHRLTAAILVIPALCRVEGAGEAEATGPRMTDSRLLGALNPTFSELNSVIQLRDEGKDLRFHVSFGERSSLRYGVIPDADANSTECRLY